MNSGSCIQLKLTIVQCKSMGSLMTKLCISALTALISALSYPPFNPWVGEWVTSDNNVDQFEFKTLPLFGWVNSIYHLSPTKRWIWDVSLLGWEVMRKPTGKGGQKVNLCGLTHKYKRREVLAKLDRRISANSIFEWHPLHKIKSNYYKFHFVCH